MGNDVRSYSGCERDEELATGFRMNGKTYNLGVAREREMYQLGLSQDVRHVDFTVGDVVSIKGGKILPLDQHLEFAGFIDGIGEDRGVYVASVFTRGCVAIKVRGLNSETHSGAKVYALPAGRTQTFSLANEGVLIGEICAIEHLDREIANVGFRLAADDRPFEMNGGSHRGGLVQSKP